MRFYRLPDTSIIYGKNLGDGAPDYIVPRDDGRIYARSQQESPTEANYLPCYGFVGDIVGPAMIVDPICVDSVTYYADINGRRFTFATRKEAYDAAIRRNPGSEWIIGYTWIGDGIHTYTVDSYDSGS